MTKQFLPFFAFKKKRSFLKLGTSLVFLIFLYSSCKKPDLKNDQAKLGMQPLSGEGSLSIDMSELYAKLPLTILHNSGNVFKLEEENAEWLYKGDSLVARVKVSGTENTYLYAVKTLRTPKETNVYIVQLNRSSSSSEESFTGTQEWIDLQTWNTYGLEFDNGVAVKNRKVETDLGVHWEKCMLEQGYFYMEPDSTIAAREYVEGLSGAAVTMDDGCPNVNGTGKNMWTRIGNIFRGAANLIITSTPYEYGNGSSGGGWNWPINWSSGGGPGGTSIGGPINGIGTPVNSDIALLKGALNLNEIEVLWLNQHLDEANEMEYFLMQDYINCNCGLSQTNRKGILRDHLTMMMQNPDYVTKINTLTGNWWDRDQNGMVAARKFYLEVYLSSNPQGMLDCDELNSLPLNLYQRVANYQIPQVVLTRINTIRNNCPPPTGFLTPNNFKIQTLAGAQGGDVNCDYFAVHINQLPQLPNNTPSTAENFLEYFRKNIGQFISSSVGVTFSPYVGYTSLGNLYLDDNIKFNSSFENSLSSLIHINMDDDGTVIETEFSRNQTTNTHRFKFTTMTTPLDNEHPVAGNREFGIFPDPNGGYCFYTAGVDRTWTTSATLYNWIANGAFEGADEVWNNMIDNVANYVNSHSGTGGSIHQKFEYIDLNGMT